MPQWSNTGRLWHLGFMPAPLGTFADPDALAVLLRERQASLGLSNAALEAVCGWSGGVVDKYLGPARTKSLSVASLAVLMDALGLTAMLVPDAAKEARARRLWSREGRRRQGAVRATSRIAKSAVARARPVVVQEMGRKGGTARWAGSTPEQRAAAVAAMNAARLAKRSRSATSG